MKGRFGGTYTDAWGGSAVGEMALIGTGDALLRRVGGGRCEALVKGVMTSAHVAVARNASCTLTNWHDVRPSPVL